MYFQADIELVHDAERYRSQQREISSEKIRHYRYVSFFIFGNSNLKHGFGLSRIFINYAYSSLFTENIQYAEQ